MEVKNLNPLDDIELTEEQGAAFIEKLQEWKDSVNEQLNEKAEMIQDELEENVEEKYSAMFEEAKQKMQEVYANRLDESLKELYSVVKEKSVRDLKENSEFQLVEKVKDLFAPFIVEGASPEGIQALREEKTKLQAELDLIKANKKLDSLLGDLDEEIADRIKPLIGEFVNEEEVVEQFTKAYELMKVTSEQVLKESQKEIEESEESEEYEEENSDLEDLLDEYAEDTKEEKEENDEEVDEGIDPDPDPIYNIDPDGKPYIEKKKKSKKGKKSLKESEEDDDALLESILSEEDYDEDIETDGEQKIPSLNEGVEDFSESEKRLRALARI